MRSSALAVTLAALAAGCGEAARPPTTTPSTSVTIPIPTGCAKVLGATAGLDVAQTTVQHFDKVQVGTELQVAVPPGTVSFTVIEQAVAAPDVITEHFAGASGSTVDPNTAVPLLVKDATDFLVHDDRPTRTVGDPTQEPSFFASESPAAGTITIPNTSAGLAAPLKPGTWKVTVSDFAYECATGNLFSTPVTCDESSTTSTYDVTVITKQAANAVVPDAGGAIDFTFYLGTQRAADATGTTTLPLKADAANAGTDPDVEQMKSTLATLLKNAGLALGTVKFVDLPADVQAAYDAGVNVDVRGACAELAQLFTRAEAGNTANIFLVSRLTGGTTGGFTVIGVDGTIPGPSSVGGTVASGAAVSTEDLRVNRTSCSATAPDFVNCGADRVAYVALHEIGHFLGLFHTTEQEGTLFDTLVDTPTCACSTCKVATGEVCFSASSSQSGNVHVMTSLECNGTRAGCGGGQNLMFWLLGSAAQGNLTAEQQKIIRSNPLVH